MLWPVLIYPSLGYYTACSSDSVRKCILASSANSFSQNAKACATKYCQMCPPNQILPSLDKATTTGYATINYETTTTFASQCDVKNFVDKINKDGGYEKWKQQGKYDWYLAAAPIWMTNPMHGPNMPGGIGAPITWFNYNKNQTGLPQGPGDGMGMFNENWDRSNPNNAIMSSCWLADHTGLDETPENNITIGMFIMDNCGHNDGVGNAVNNLKWCVPFEFPDYKTGVCPICAKQYLDMCYPDLQAAQLKGDNSLPTGADMTCNDQPALGERVILSSDPNVRKVQGVYTASYCPGGVNNTSASCWKSTEFYTKKNAQDGYTITFDPTRKLTERCANNYLFNGWTREALPQWMRPRLGTCTMDTAKQKNRCRNMYGYAYHFDIGAYQVNTTDQGWIFPPWYKLIGGKIEATNTLLSNVRKVSCPTNVQNALLASCGRPNPFGGNTLDYNSEENTWLPLSHCGTTVGNCKASAADGNNKGLNGFCESQKCAAFRAATTSNIQPPGLPPFPSPSPRPPFIPTLPSQPPNPPFPPPISPAPPPPPSPPPPPPDPPYLPTICNSGVPQLNDGCNQEGSPCCPVTVSCNNKQCQPSRSSNEVSNAKCLPNGGTTKLYNACTTTEDCCQLDLPPPICTNNNQCTFASAGGSG